MSTYRTTTRSHRLCLAAALVVAGFWGSASARAQPTSSTTVSPRHIPAPAQPIRAAAMPQPVTWSPPAWLVAKLAAPVSVHGFTIQPPKGFQQAQALHAPPQNVTFTAWLGSQRDKKGQQPGLIFMTFTPPVGSNYTRERVLELLANALRHGSVKLVQSPVDSGRIYGLDFVRSYWTIMDPSTKLAARGMLYVAQFGASFISLSGEDYDPYAKDTLPILEAAIQSVKVDPRAYPAAGVQRPSGR